MKLNRQTLLKLALAGLLAYGGGYYTAYQTAQDAFNPRTDVKIESAEIVNKVVWEIAFQRGYAQAEAKYLKGWKWYMSELHFMGMLLHEGLVPQCTFVGK